MKDLQQSKRSFTEVYRDIERESIEHRDLIDAFHRMWYSSRNTHGFTFYEGIPLIKCPLDLWVYQEIIWDMKPTLIIETGTAFGGSALYFARQLDRLESGIVLTIDLEPAPTLPKHPRIEYLAGMSSTDGRVVDAVTQVAKTHPRVMVVLDSDHSMDHVLEELWAYAPLVTAGQFLVVEDTNINGRPVETSWHGGDGPGPAVDYFMENNQDFVRAWLAERYMLTFYPGGWLRRLTPEEQAAIAAEGASHVE